MFERFSESARRAVFFARNEALQSGSSQIEAVDLLLGLLQEDSHLIPEADAEIIRREIKGENHQRLARSAEVGIPLSEEAKKALAAAAEEAEGLGHCAVGTSHLLLGVLREPNLALATILRSFGYNLEEEKERLKSFPAPSLVRDISLTGVQDFTLLGKMTDTVRRMIHR
jgi:ATP-dependent Clp protease ATP-binding subunit ClpC